MYIFAERFEGMKVNELRMSLIKLPSGARYPLLITTHGLPHRFATLFVTTQMHNAGRATNTNLSALSAIRTALQWAEGEAIDLYARFSGRQFLNPGEIETLCRSLSQAQRTASRRVGLMTKRRSLGNVAERSRARLGYAPETVASMTRYTRISYVAAYLKWLAVYSVEEQAKLVDDESMAQIREMEASLKAHRPHKRRGALSTLRRGLSEVQQNMLLDLVDPQSSDNPFADAVRARNGLIVQTLYQLGIRAGELLGLRIDDVDFRTNTVLVARRHGDPLDPRHQQPVAKTCDRRLPLADPLARQISHYVLQVRGKIRPAKRHPYLFVTHRRGPHWGSPLSIQGLCKVFVELQKACPEHFGSLTAHVLRHTANDRFSALMDKGRVPAAKEEKMRAYLMGWKEGSGTASTYTRRHVEDAAQKAALLLQAHKRKARVVQA